MEALLIILLFLGRGEAITSSLSTTPMPTWKACILASDKIRKAIPIRAGASVFCIPIEEK